MTIENLIRAAASPPEPGDPFIGPWEVVEAELGTALPPDYKELVRRYGYGYWLEFIGIDVPRCRNPNMRLEEQVRLECDVIRKVGLIEHPLWPEPGGLMPFGGTDNGDTLAWVTRGAPEEWRVAVLPDDTWGEVELLDCDVTDFLAGLATGSLRPKGLPDDLWDCPPERLFVPFHSPPAAIVEVSWRLGSFGLGPSGSSRCRLPSG